MADCSSLLQLLGIDNHNIAVDELTDDRDRRVTPRKD